MGGMVMMVKEEEITPRGARIVVVPYWDPSHRGLTLEIL